VGCVFKKDKMAQQMNRIYYPSGKVYLKGPSIDGTKVGEWVQYNEKGEVLGKWGFVGGTIVKSQKFRLIGNKIPLVNFDYLDHSKFKTTLV